ncbi:hypothetical protein SAMN05444172_8862 [Burkholderia sp. GAS332]|nr:hypothetical protein SAMN05444172_8862 [Burkholderia sp. GAS332]
MRIKYLNGAGGAAKMSWPTRSVYPYASHTANMHTLARVDTKVVSDERDAHSAELLATMHE